MPVGSQGQVRPADVVGAAVRTMKIATGEVVEDIERPDGEIGSQVFVVEVPEEGVESAGRQAVAEPDSSSYLEDQ